MLQLLLISWIQESEIITVLCFLSSISTYFTDLKKEEPVRFYYKMFAIAFFME